MVYSKTVHMLWRWHGCAMAIALALALVRSNAPDIDLTGLPQVDGTYVSVFGVIDHGSRAVIELVPLARYNSLILLGKLLVAFGTLGKPLAVRCDNDAVFKTAVFRGVLKLLGVQQQFTEVASPWQNGRIERFWRTLKEALGAQPLRCSDGLRVVQLRMKWASLAATSAVLDVFKARYNHDRPHQSLQGLAPGMVWRKQVKKRLARASLLTRASACHPPSCTT